MSGSFFDSNVLIHLAQADERKAARILELVSGRGTVSVQVLNEIANVSRKKFGKPWNEIAAFLGLLRGLLSVVPVTIEVHELGLTLADRYRLSTYDSMILAAALDAGCDTLWSEDMQHGFVVQGRLTIRNPYLPT